MTVTTLEEYACTIIEANLQADTVLLKMKPGYRVRAGKHWLLTDEAYERLCRKVDPAP